MLRNKEISLPMRFTETKPLPRDVSRFTEVDLAPLDAAMTDDYPASLRDVAGSIYFALLETPILVSKLSTREIAELALLQVEILRHQVGGRQFYMPKGTTFGLAARDRGINAEFNGRNLCHLARKHGLSEQQVRNILKGPRRPTDQPQSPDKKSR